MKLNVRRSVLLVAIAAALAVLAAGCGGGDSSSDAGTTEDAAAPTTVADTGAADTGATAAGGETEAASDEPVRIASFLLAFANSYSQANKLGVEQAAEAGNAEVKFFDGKFDGATQLKQLQDATASGEYDAFVLFANDGTAVAPAVEDAIADGIKVVAVYTPIGPDVNSLDQQVEGLSATVGNPVEGDGIGIGNATVDACGDTDPCEVVYVSGGFSIPFEVMKFEAFKQVIAEHPNIELVGQGEAGFLREEGYTVAQDLLQSHPNLSVFATSGDQMTFGAEQAMTDAGIPPGQIALIGNGAAVEAVEAVAEGRWHSSFVYMPITEGRIGTELAIDAVHGELTDYQSVPMIEESPVGEFVTQDNAADFTPEWNIG